MRGRGVYAHLHTRKEMRCQSDLEARVLRRRAARRKNKCWLHSRFALRLEADGGATHFHTPLTNDGHRRPLLAGHSHSDPEKKGRNISFHGEYSSRYADAKRTKGWHEESKPCLMLESHSQNARYSHGCSAHYISD